MKNEHPDIDWAKRTITLPDGTIAPVKDAKFPLVLQPSQQSKEKGVPRDPRRCMYAVEFQNKYPESQLPYFGHEVAYADLRTANGIVYFRWILSDPAQSEAIAFDGDEYVTLEAVAFNIPRGSRRLNARLKAGRQWREKQQAKKLAKELGEPEPETKEAKPKREAHVKGTLKKKKKTRPAAVKPWKVRDDGRGMFQFKEKPAKAKIISA